MAFRLASTRHQMASRCLVDDYVCADMMMLGTFLVSTPFIYIKISFCKCSPVFFKFVIDTWQILIFVNIFPQWYGGVADLSQWHSLICMVRSFNYKHYWGSLRYTDQTIKGNPFRLARATWTVSVGSMDICPGISLDLTVDAYICQSTIDLL